MKLDLMTEFHDVGISLSIECYATLDNVLWFRVDFVITTLFLSSFTSPL
jgi:hypothetical protein